MSREVVGVDVGGSFLGKKIVARRDLRYRTTPQSHIKLAQKRHERDTLLTSLEIQAS